MFTLISSGWHFFLSKILPIVSDMMAGQRCCWWREWPILWGTSEQQYYEKMILYTLHTKRFTHDQRWTRLHIFQAPRSFLALKHAKFLQSALSLFRGVFPCKLSNIAAYIIGAFFALLSCFWDHIFAAFCWMGVILFSVIYVFRGR